MYSMNFIIPVSTNLVLVTVQQNDYIKN